MRVVVVIAGVSAALLAASCANEVEGDLESEPSFDDGVSLEQGMHDCTEHQETGYKNGSPFPITTVTVDGKPLEVHTANAYLALQAAAAKDGVDIVVVSGFRTMAEQQYLYHCYQTGSCNGGNLAAVPGYSNHQSGHAIDMNTSSPGVYSWLENHGAHFGWARTVPSEIWHWEWWGNASDYPGPCGAGGGGGGGANNPPPKPAGPPPMHWFTGDFDGNGKIDLGKVWNQGGAIDSDVHTSTGSAFDMHRYMTNQGAYDDSMKWVVGDFDGDGKADLLDYWNDGGKFSADVHLTRSGHFDIKRFSTKDGGIPAGTKFFSGDFDGDGRADILKVWNDGGDMSCDVYLSTGASFKNVRFATKQGGYWDSQIWKVGDFDGDGKTDLMKLWNDNGNMTADVHLSKGDHFEMHRFATKQGGMSDGMKWFVGDFDGDGKADLMKLWDDGGKMDADVHLSSGSAFTMHRFATKQGAYSDSMQWHVGDFDGDGAMDLMKLWNDGGDMTADVHLSSGSAFVMHRFATKQGGIWDGMHWIVGDFNGDGKADLAKFWDDGGDMDVDVHTSNGSTFTMHRFATKQGGIW
jgi:hypothetical protein